MDKTRKYHLHCAICNANAKGTGKELMDAGWGWCWIQTGWPIQDRYVKSREVSVSVVGCPDHKVILRERARVAMDMLLMR
jgi:hypothetical protein